jgi:hypothetical protein
MLLLRWLFLGLVVTTGQQASSFGFGRTIGGAISDWPLTANVEMEAWSHNITSAAGLECATLQICARLAAPQRQRFYSVAVQARSVLESLLVRGWQGIARAVRSRPPADQILHRWGNNGVNRFRAGHGERVRDWLGGTVILRGWSKCKRALGSRYEQ